MQEESQSQNWSPEKIEKFMDKFNLNHQKKSNVRPSHRPIRTYCRVPRLLPDGTIKEAYT